MSRAWPPLLAGVLLAALVARWLPATAEPGLRALLVLAPAVAGLLAATGRALGRPRWPLDERVTLAALLVLAGGGDRLGFAGIEPLVALGGFALVGWRVLRLTPGLARALGRVGAARWLPFAAVAFAVYLAVLPWASARRPPNGDEPHYLLLTDSLASDFDVDLTDEYRQERWRAFDGLPVVPQVGDPVGAGGEQYSRHEPFLPFLLVPFWVVGGLTGVRIAMAAATAALGTAILTAMLALGVRRRGALRAWALAACAPPLLTFSHQIWVEVPAALLVALALGAWGRARAGDRGWRRSGLWTFALPLALLPLLKVRLLALALPLALLGASGTRARHRLAWTAALAVGGVAAAVMAVNVALWGNPLHMHSLAELALYEVPPGRFLRGGVGLFFDLAFGLLAAAPLWLVAVPGVVTTVRRRHAAALALAALVPYLVLVASRREWYGGWSPAFRYGLVMLPVLALAVGVLLARRPPAAARVLLGLLLGASALITAAVLAEPGWAFNFADGRSALLDLATRSFRADFARLLPSAVRPRPATWLVPLVASALALVAWRLPGRRPRAAASAGVALLLVGAAALLVGAHRLPTRVAEIEDPWVAKSGGRVWPGPWTFDRTRYPGGWLLPEGAHAVLRPVAGGPRVDVEVTWMAFRHGPETTDFEIAVGERVVRRYHAQRAGVWRTHRIAGLAWPPGSRLVLRCVPSGRRARDGVVVDRVVLRWH